MVKSRWFNQMKCCVPSVSLSSLSSFSAKWQDWVKMTGDGDRRSGWTRCHTWLIILSALYDAWLQPLSSLLNHEMFLPQSSPDLVFIYMGKQRVSLLQVRVELGTFVVPIESPNWMQFTFTPKTHCSVITLRTLNNLTISIYPGAPELRPRYRNELH